MSDPHTNRNTVSHICIYKVQGQTWMVLIFLQKKNSCWDYMDQHDFTSTADNLLMYSQCSKLYIRLYLHVWNISKNKSYMYYLTYSFSSPQRVRIRVMVFSGTFNNISVILWRSVLLVDETTNLSQVTDKLLNSQQALIAQIVVNPTTIYDHDHDGGISTEYVKITYTSQFKSINNNNLWEKVNLD